MVKGNKFKPGEPSKKKRRLAEDAQPPLKPEEPVDVKLIGPTYDEDAVPAKRKLAKESHESKKGSVHGVNGNSQAVQPVNAPKRQKLANGVHAKVAPAEHQSPGNQIVPLAVNLELQEAPPASAAKPAATAKPSTNKRKKARQKAKLREKLKLVELGKGDASQSKESIEAKLKALSEQAIGSNGAVRNNEKAKSANEGGVVQGVKTTTVQPAQGTAGSQNWAQIKQLIGAGVQKDRHLKGDLSISADGLSKRPEPKGQSSELTPVVAIDCEMVGVGPDGVRSSLARVCIVNEQGNVLMDKFVRQKEKVTDYRTQHSGIRPEDVSAENAESFEDVQKEAFAIIRDRIVVGHAVHNDFRALLLSHPSKMIRDTAKYPPLMRSMGPGRRPKPRKLRHLAFEELGLGIQSGEHSPVEDARAALYLYQRFAKEWERHLKRGTVKQLRAPPSKKQIQDIQTQTAKNSLAALASNDYMADL